LMRPCKRQGCPEIVEGTYCEAHQPTTRTPEQQARPDYGSRWPKLRAAHLKREPLCRLCEMRGHVTPAQDVDHLVPWRGNHTLLLASWNLQSLCRRCHARKTASDARTAGLRYPNPPQPLHGPLRVVCGPPAAGKTTYARQLGGRIVDLDDILRSLGATPRMVTSELIRDAMTIRNGRLQQGSADILVAMLPGQHERRFWSEVWGAEVHRLTAPDPVLRARIMKRPDARREQSLEALRRWSRQWTPDHFDAPVVVVDASKPYD